MPEPLTLRRGIYPPLPTFFTTHEELDLPTFKQHIQRLTGTGVAGYVVMGTNGEAVHLERAERGSLIEAAREAAGAETPLLAGCGEQSTRATIANCQLAASAGADFALVLPPSYFKGRMNAQALLTHYQLVADASPLPLVLYNMPASTAGLDLDAATVLTLATHPHITGVKDSAGDITKLAQIIAQAPEDFLTFAGSAGYLLPALAVGAAGAVSALANIFPHHVCQVQTRFAQGQIDTARQLQGQLIAANTAVTSTYSVPGLKAALEIVAGYGGKPRLPLQALGVDERQQLAAILAALPPYNPDAQDVVTVKSTR